MGRSWSRRHADHAVSLALPPDLPTAVAEGGRDDLDRVSVDAAALNGHVQRRTHTASCRASAWCQRRANNPMQFSVNLKPRASLQYAHTHHVTNGIPDEDDDEGFVVLVDERGKNSRFVKASIGESGLVIAGHDMGPAVEMFFKRDDYEFWYTVPPRHLAALALRIGAEHDTILQTLEADWSGARFNDLEEILEDPALEVTFTSF